MPAERPKSQERTVTTVEILKRELDKILEAQSQCANEEGIVYPYMRQRYLVLVKEAKAFRESILWLEEQGIGVRI